MKHIPKRKSKDICLSKLDIFIYLLRKGWKPEDATKYILTGDCKGQIHRCNKMIDEYTKLMENVESIYHKRYWEENIRACRNVRKAFEEELEDLENKDYSKLFSKDNV